MSYPTIDVKHGQEALKRLLTVLFLLCGTALLAQTPKVWVVDQVDMHFGNFRWGTIGTNPPGGPTVTLANGVGTPAVAPTSALTRRGDSFSVPFRVRWRVAPLPAGFTGRYRVHLDATTTTLRYNTSNIAFQRRPWNASTEHYDQWLTLAADGTTELFTFGGMATIPWNAAQGLYSPTSQTTSQLPVRITLEHTNSANNWSGVFPGYITLRLDNLYPTATLAKNQDLDFGAIVPGPTPGTVVLDPTSAATYTGVWRHSSRTPTAAMFTLTFNGNSWVRTFLKVPTAPVTLTGPGGATMTVDNFVSEWDWDWTNLTRHVGATLHVGANQTPGNYTGTFQVTIDFY